MSDNTVPDKENAMKKISLIILASCLPIWYWVAIVQITTHYWDEATFHYHMGAMHYKFGVRDLGKLDGEMGDKYKQRGNNTLLWLPKFVRPKQVK